MLALQAKRPGHRQGATRKLLTGDFGTRRPYTSFSARSRKKPRISIPPSPTISRSAPANSTFPPGAGSPDSGREGTPGRRGAPTGPRYGRPARRRKKSSSSSPRRICCGIQTDRRRLRPAQCHCTPTLSDLDLLYDSALIAERLGKFDILEARLRHLASKSNPIMPTALNALGYSFADRNIRLAEAYELSPRPRPRPQRSLHHGQPGLGALSARQDR